MIKLFTISILVLAVLLQSCASKKIENLKDKPSIAYDFFVLEGEQLSESISGFDFILPNILLDDYIEARSLLKFIGIESPYFFFAIQRRNTVDLQFSMWVIPDFADEDIQENSIEDNLIGEKEIEYTDIFLGIDGNKFNKSPRISKYFYRIDLNGTYRVINRCILSEDFSALLCAEVKSFKIS